MSLARARALVWAETDQGAVFVQAELCDLFADEYAAMIQEIPVNRYPDLPLPEPADFADEFLYDTVAADPEPNLQNATRLDNLVTQQDFTGEAGDGVRGDAPRPHARKVDHSMTAMIHPTADGQWIVICEPCGLFPPDSSGKSDQDASERSAAIHNSDIHRDRPYPEWAEVARWCDEQRMAGAL